MAGTVRTEIVQTHLDIPAPLSLRLTIGEASTAPAARSVRWVAAAVDNEGLGRRSSKRCCIFHKKRAFGEGEEVDEGGGGSVGGSEGAGRGLGAGSRLDDKDRSEHGNHVQEPHADEHPCEQEHGAQSNAATVDQLLESDASAESCGDCEHCKRYVVLEAEARERQAVARGCEELQSAS